MRGFPVAGGEGTRFGATIWGAVDGDRVEKAKLPEMEGGSRLLGASLRCPEGVSISNNRL